MNTNSKRRCNDGIGLIVTYQEVTKDDAQLPVGQPQTTRVVGDISDDALHMQAAQFSAGTLFVDIVSVVPA
jgi:hypothetical protein